MKNPQLFGCTSCGQVVIKDLTDAPDSCGALELNDLSEPTECLGIMKPIYIGFQQLSFDE